MTPPFDGTDISGVQWPGIVQAIPTLKAMGATLLTCKATEGANYRMPSWPQIRKLAKDNGFEFRGPYHWLRPDSSTADQLKNFRGYVGDIEVGECIQLDCEQAGLTGAQIADAYKQWSAVYPGRVLVYTPIAWVSAVPDAPWWLPYYIGTHVKQYSDVPLPKGRTPIIWQWGGGAEGVKILPFAPSGIDSNQVIDKITLRSLCGYSAKPPVIDPIPETIDEGLLDMDADEVKAVVQAAMLELLRSDEFKAIVVQAAHDADVGVMRSDEFTATVAAAVK